MRFFRDLILTVLATAVVLAGLEGGLRLAQVRFEASFYQPERERGYALRPNAKGWSVGEADVYVRINSDGMRDRERPVARPPQTLRVAIIGASDAVAAEVPFEKTFKSVMNRDLSQALEPRGWQADVLTFGVGGYTLSQQYLTLHDHVWKYEPQVVVLLFSSSTVLKTTRTFFPGELQGAPVYLLNNGELVPDSITRNAPPISARSLLWKNRTSDWMNASRLLSLLNISRIKAGEAIAGFRLKAKRAAASSAPPERWHYDPSQPEVQESWAIAEALMHEMKADCALHHAEFWIAIGDQGVQVHPDLTERIAFQRRLGLTSLDAINQRVERFGAAEGIPTITLARPLGEYAASHGVFLHGPPAAKTNAGHWNELGNGIAGHAIAGELLAHSLAIRRAAEEQSR
jgi:hypothetical protein